MPCIGKARVGHKAPPFNCEAVIDGGFKDLTLEYYIAKKQWLILMFIPAAFSFVCPTEVLAFHNCIDEFTERNCAVAFVSTDSKYSLWHWQHLPKHQGGIGEVSVPLLSDQSHQMSRDYGVLLEKSGLDLRGMFIIDPKGIVQQMTINNIAVGRSVLEALRLVEAFKAVAEKGVLCPVGWRGPDDNMTDTSFEERDAQIARGLGEMKVKNLDNNTQLSLILPSLKTTPTGDSEEASSREASRRSTKETKSSKEVNTVSKESNAAISVAPSKRTSQTISPRSSNPHAVGHAQDPNVVTLDFADLLEANVSPKSGIDPHEFVSVEERKSGAGTPMSRTVDALKRFSGGWPSGPSPLSSPVREFHGKNNSGTATPSSYFE